MIQRLLLIKLTSLGDLIHALPALTDALLAYPELQIDWLIDENFQEIAHWHPAIKNIFTTNHRKWRASLKELTTYTSIFNLLKTLRKKRYDLIIDGQGNFKTAALASCLKGVKAGYDRHSVREKVAFLAYQKTFSISKQAHAVDRLRILFAYALGYDVPHTQANFLLDHTKFIIPPINLPPHYLIFVHNASWKTKLWPEEHWKRLIKQAVGQGHTIFLPWGNAEEEARAQRLAISKQVHVLPKLSLSEVAYVLSKAAGCVCVDTGLSHLAAALNIPSVTLYGSTDSGLIGASGNNQHHFQSSLSCAPCQKKKCLHPSDDLNPPCLAALHPDRIFAHLTGILSKY
jgi:heptosyltransferase-1